VRKSVTKLGKKSAMLETPEKNMQKHRVCATIPKKKPTSQFGGRGLATCDSKKLKKSTAPRLQAKSFDEAQNLGRSNAADGLASQNIAVPAEYAGASSGSGDHS